MGQNNILIILSLLFWLLNVNLVAQGDIKVMSAEIKYN